MKWILYLALTVGFVNGLFCSELPKGSYYILNSFFVFLLCLFIYIKNRNSFINFVLVMLSFSTLLDELFFDNTVISVNELLIALSIPFIWVFRKKNETNTIKQ